MMDIVASLESRLDEVNKRARAHEISWEYHRSMDARLNVAAKILSAVIGTGVFVGLVSRLGLDGKAGSLSVPAGWESLYWAILLVSLAGPAVTALHVALHNAQDAEGHRRSCADYRVLADALASFLSQPVSDTSVARRAQEDFTERFRKIEVESISLAPRARKAVGLPR